MILWIAACQAPLFMGFSWQEYWSGLPFPSPEDQTCVSYVFCIGRWILYYSLHLLCIAAAAAAAKSLQSCPTLCDPRDGSPLGSSVPGILLARILEWVAISFSNILPWNSIIKVIMGLKYYLTCLRTYAFAHVRVTSLYHLCSSCGNPVTA